MGRDRTGHPASGPDPYSLRLFEDFPTGKQAIISYRFDDMNIDVPHSTAPDSPAARWRINGTLSISTTDKDQ